MNCKRVIVKTKSNKKIKHFSTRITHYLFIAKTIFWGVWALPIDLFYCGLIPFILPPPYFKKGGGSNQIHIGVI